MSKTRTTTLAYSVVGDSNLHTELGHDIRVAFNTHVLDERGYTLGIVSGSDITLSLDDAQEMLDSLKKAIKSAKSAQDTRAEVAL
jgi:hypothetical protein